MGFFEQKLQPGQSISFNWSLSNTPYKTNLVIKQDGAVKANAFSNAEATGTLANTVSAFPTTWTFVVYYQEIDWGVCDLTKTFDDNKGHTQYTATNPGNTTYPTELDGTIDVTIQ
jgi:hypothetical protein